MEVPSFRTEVQRFNDVLSQDAVRVYPGDDMRVNTGYDVRVYPGDDMRVNTGYDVGVDARNDVRINAWDYEARRGQVRSDHDQTERCYNQSSECYQGYCPDFHHSSPFSKFCYGFGLVNIKEVVEHALDIFKYHKW